MLNIMLVAALAISKFNVVDDTALFITQIHTHTHTYKHTHIHLHTKNITFINEA